jgi:hypothetical protein
MTFEEALNLNEETSIIIEEVGDDYVHNTNGKGFFSILKTGKLEGKVQRDKVTPNPKDKELCMSRSDMKPQHTGYSPSQYLNHFGNFIKISLKMDNIRNDLRLKKPYPVSYGYFNKMRSLKYELNKYKDKIKTPEGKKLYRNLISILIDNSYRHQGMKKAPSEEEIKQIVLKIAKIENIRTEMDNALEAFYAVQEGGEERLIVPNGIPIRAKYMTISIPYTVWENDGENVQKAINAFQKKFGLSDEEINELFKKYKDTSRTAYRIKNNLPKVSSLDRLRKFSY